METEDVKLSNGEGLSLAEIKLYLGDPKWRLNNLYYIKDEKGHKVLFKFNKVQEFLYDNLWYWNIVPKARQLGITTFFSILYLDQVLFGENQTATIIAHTEKDMKKIFKNKIKFAWDNLHPWLKKKIGEPDTNTANELSFPNGGIVSVALSSRSDTVQFLHISEFGKICAKFPDKAEEIVTGAINAVHAGNMVSIESTAEGREGYFYDFVHDSEKKRKEGRELTPLDFKIFFFPWWIDNRYILDGNFAFSREQIEYFKKLEQKEGIKLTDEQKRWYIKKKEIQKDKMFQEYPSTLEEAFSVTTEGAYYAHEMNLIYQQNRIRVLPVVDGVKVDTWWDLGMDDFTVIIFVQTVGPQIRIVDVYYNRGYKLAHYVDVLKEKKYSYGRHIFPHDIEVKDYSTGITRKQTLYELGLFNVIVAPKLGIDDGIERVRNIFSRMYFDEERTKPLYDALGNYRRDFDAKLGAFKKTPRHDNNSHFADAMRTGGVVWREEPIYGSEYEKEQAEKQQEQAFFG
jgi:hypothetical protein